MDMVQILSTIILISTLITLIVAIASYMTFRIKEKKKQQQMAEFSDVFASDLAALQDDGVTEAANSLPMVEIEPLKFENQNNPSQSMPPASPNGSNTTVVIAPPVIMNAPAAPAQAPQQPYPQQAQQPQQMPYGQPQYGQMPPQGFQPQMNQYGQPPMQGYPQQPPQTDPYANPFAPPPQPQPNYSGAQAAFMKGFDGQQAPPPPRPGSEYGQQPAMKRFTPPESRPKQEPPPAYGNDSPTWK